MGVAQWIPDFATRLTQLEKLAQLGSFVGVEVWLGGLFFPEAYVTATRQAVAQRNGWSLETLYLYLDIDQPDDTSAFVVEGTSSLMRFWETDFSLPFEIGLTIEGATYSGGKLCLNSGESVRIGRAQVRWVQKVGTEKDVPNGDIVQTSPSSSLPVYLNSERNDVLFTVDLPFEQGVEHLVAIRAVCLTAGG